MSSRSIATIRVEDAPTTAQLASVIDQANSELYVTSGSKIRFVALSVPDYERMQRRQQRLIMRAHYTRALIQAGHTGPELQKLLSVLDADDETWLDDPGAARERMLQESQAAFRVYCKEQGVEYETMSEEDIDLLTDRLVEQARADVHDSQSGS